MELNLVEEKRLAVLAAQEAEGPQFLTEAETIELHTLRMKEISPAIAVPLTAAELAKQKTLDMPGLVARVRAHTNAQGAVILLVMGLVTLIEEAGGSPELATSLRESAAGLAEAVVANTPAA